MATSPNNYQPRQDIDFTIPLLGVVLVLILILTH